MELINNLAEQVSVIPTLTQQLTDLNASMVELAKREQKSNIPDMMKYSKEPWMQFVSGKIDPDKGVELSIDWNTAFIEQLKQNGYTGISELQIVSKYIASVANKCQQSVHGDE